MYYKSNELKHYGTKGMKWGRRRYRNPDGSLTAAGKRRYGPDKVNIDSRDSAVTKRVKNDYNSMSNEEFKGKYQTSKKRYAKRVEKYGDPYKNSPLAKAGKKLRGVDNDKQKAAKVAEKELESIRESRAKAAAKSSKISGRLRDKQKSDGDKAKVKSTIEKLSVKSSDSAITKRVKNDYNNMSDKEFKAKYASSKKTYAKRVEKYGDPYKHATRNIKDRRQANNYAEKELEAIKRSRTRR